ncbi:MAG TPA: tRNA guanosine(34) transglycosylase Tgt [Spirochaetia bacterium]|nr:tRNA guanosine(34) transglycosylase Tgt [Spirochaetia bacterium]
METIGSSDIFSVDSVDRATPARTGTLRLPHGSLPTPVFMPVGTAGTVKAIRHDELSHLGFRLILGNTYHLYLRPGTEVIDAFGGLHRFSGWPHNILTDSGGYQVFSLAPFRKIEEEGVYFRSHVDGSSHTLTPEKVVGIQRILDSDIQMALDVCTAPGISMNDAKLAADRTYRWAARAKSVWLSIDTAYRGVLFGIVQGNFYRDLRRKSVEEIVSLELPGIAIGGLSVGESYDVFLEFLSYTAALLPAAVPRYLMGIGSPRYILDAVANGIDMFDCVFPTRIARNGTVFTRSGRLALKREEYTRDTGPIDPACGCAACRTYSRAYLRHLFKAGEMLGPMLATNHNLFFLQNFMEEIREAIRRGEFAAFRAEFLENYPAKEG